MKACHHARASWFFHSNVAWLSQAREFCQKLLNRLDLMYVSPRLPDTNNKDLKFQWHWEADSVLHQFTKVFDVKTKS